MVLRQTVTKRGAHLLFCALALLVSRASFAADRVAEVRFHGNYSIPDDEMARLADVPIGAELSENGTELIKERLLRSRRFESVQVQKRYRSMSGTGDIVLMIGVKERPPVKSKFMFMPIISGSDEYGLSYGGRITAIDLLGAGERISFPATWGGIRRAAVEARVDPRVPLADDLFGGTSISRKKNPHFELFDRRSEAWGGLAKNLRWFKLEIGGGWSDVKFGSLNQSFINYGANLSFDTRQDLNMPRDAVYASVGWERMAFEKSSNLNRYKLDLRGFKAVRGQSVLAGQFFYHKADGRLPDYQRPFLGGSGTLRGHRPGEFVGDNLILTSVECRVPLTSPLSFYRAGFDLFLDSGAVFDHGASIGTADFKHGAGVGIFLLVAGFGIKVDLAYDLHRSVRLHFSTGFRF